MKVKQKKLCRRQDRTYRNGNGRRGQQGLRLRRVELCRQTRSSSRRREVGRTGHQGAFEAERRRLGHAAPGHGGTGALRARRQGHRPHQRPDADLRRHPQASRQALQLQGELHPQARCRAELVRAGGRSTVPKFEYDQSEIGRRLTQYHAHVSRLRHRRPASRRQGRQLPDRARGNPTTARRSRTSRRMRAC